MLIQFISIIFTTSFSFVLLTPQRQIIEHRNKLGKSWTSQLSPFFSTSYKPLSTHLHSPCSSNMKLCNEVWTAWTFYLLFVFKYFWIYCFDSVILCFFSYFHSFKFSSTSPIPFEHPFKWLNSHLFVLFQKLFHCHALLFFLSFSSSKTLQIKWNSKQY